MNVATAQWMVEYHDWANARLLRAADGIDATELVASRAVPCGSLRGTFVHILSAEWIWRQRWPGASPAAMLDEREVATLPDVIVRWDAERAAMRAFLAELDDAALARPVQFANTRGVPQTPVPLWQLLLHGVNHGTQHRSEAALILTDLGHSPGDLDADDGQRGGSATIARREFMDVATAQWMIEYHYWANARLLRAADGIDATELVAPRAVPCGSLRGTFVHILSAEWIWRQRWQGASPAAMLDEREFATLADVIVRWDAEQAAMRAFLAELDDAALARPVQFTNTRGVPQTPVPLWQLLLHCVNHGTQHRSEAALILTDLGRSPGDLDMALLLRERAAAA